ncbi:hypothetical protein TRFO_16922 [Tritrichomonas foetus]|uniref:Uncharacterized protein n=1 Tax=Tritrichomonas foetus TaxID=1144522 RepID=A0A1J4KNW1_9EUKA|nr:hypothetical protein TRFO_16922 [Tritrichomonas foetus]|eukprot:OHT12975.1 hypothetical protein TRFO_16922 [Tritrichomonas foetus]
MSTVVLSRLIQPQFSFMFSNYSSSNVKTTMKAHIELDNLQFHPENISFYLSAFGPYRLTSGSISHLLIKKSLISADTTPIRIECDDIVMNLDFLDGEDAKFEYDVSKIPSLSYPAESVEAEMDTCTLKFTNMKINLNFLNKFQIIAIIPTFIMYATNSSFLIATPLELRQLISQKGFAYNEAHLQIEKICVLEKKPNFNELLGQFCEMMPVIARYIVKKRTITLFNQSEIDIFFQKDLVIHLNTQLIEALKEISAVYQKSMKAWDARKRLYQVCNHVPPMLSFFTRITTNFKSIICHVQDEDMTYDTVVSKGASFSIVMFPDCLFIWRNIMVIPPFEFFINGEQIIKGSRGTRTLKIPQTDIIERSYLNSKGYFLFAEQLTNSKDGFCHIDVSAQGKLFIDKSGENFKRFKTKLSEIFGLLTYDKQVKGNLSILELLSKNERKKHITTSKNTDFAINEENGKITLFLKTERTDLAPLMDEENEGKINIKNTEAQMVFTTSRNH